MQDEGVQPDIVFVSRARSQRLVPEGIRGAPDLVVEILSPGTAQRDRSIKKKLYERQGVAQYWIVDPDDESVEVWNFGAGPAEARRFTDRLPVRMAKLDAGEIFLPEIFPAEREGG